MAMVALIGLPFRRRTSSTPPSSERTSWAERMARARPMSARRTCLDFVTETDRHNHKCDCPESDEELGSGSIRVGLESTLCYTISGTAITGQSAKFPMATRFF